MTFGAWFVLLSLLDCVTTMWGLSVGLKEGNIFMASLVTHPVWFVIVKAGFALTVIKYVSLQTLKLGVAVMAAVVTWNLVLILGGF